MTTGSRVTSVSLGALVLWIAIAPPAAAREGSQEPGTGSVGGGTAAPGEGAVTGRIVDGETGAPVQGVIVTVLWPDPGDGARPRQEVRVTNVEGAFEFPGVPAGRYELRLDKAGHPESTIANFEVQAGQQNRADLTLPRLPSEAGEALFDLPSPPEVIVVTGRPVATAQAKRLASDQILDVMDGEDLAKFASGDVAEALKRLPGVNVVEGQFAIIRGLEDRYSSTLYNSAPIPSPDPDRQSVQLDLFPSEVISNLVVAKTFAPALPGNSAAGSLDIVTSGYPEAEGLFDAKLSAKTGLNQNAWDEFLRFEQGSPMGHPTDGADVLEQEYGGFLGGRSELLGRELRFKAIGNWGTDYQTEEGFQQGRAPSSVLQGLPFGRLDLTSGRFDLTTSSYEEQLTAYGGFGFDLDESGNHKIDAAVFWTRKDEEEVELRENGYLPGFDYGAIAELEFEQGQEIANSDFLGDGAGVANPGRNGAFSSWIASGVRNFTQFLPPTSGHSWIASFMDSKSFDRQRDLTVYQVNGDHAIPALGDLHLRWAANHATTAQDDAALGARFYFEPCGLDPGTAPLRCPAGVAPIELPAALPTSFPVTVDALGPGSYLANDGIFLSSNAIDENQDFGRLDADYATEILPWLGAELRSGLWYERAARDVGSTFLDAGNVSVGTTGGCAQTPGCLGSTVAFAIFADTPRELGRRIFGDSSPLAREPDGSFQNLLSTRSEAKREIQAWNASAKATLWEQLDLLGGIRLEKIRIESKNDPFVPGVTSDGTPRIFPSKYLFFDRQDNRARGELGLPSPFNDEILGIEVPIGPCRDRNGNVIPNGGECVDLIDEAQIAGAISGKIDELYLLPSAGLGYRPWDGLTLRGAWSRTVARPSFREIGYYVSTEPGTDDLTVGNPQLQLSEVESFDARAEYVWGEVGDLAALSAFYKLVDDPIEQIILRDAGVRDVGSLALFRTFFNNPSEATVWGIEVEARKNLGFLGPELLSHFSIGGNFSWIGAEVDRSDAELARATVFFRDPPDDAPFQRLKKSRRLTNQPEWIANADLSFDQPEWGTRVTLAFFAISDVLDAVGGATEFDLTGQVNARAFTLDRYLDSFYQLDLIVSQNLWRGLALKLTLKNLTDSERAIVYDPGQTAGRISEREYRVGRDVSMALSWAFSGPDL